jgi:hypothetical protein
MTIEQALQEQTAAIRENTRVLASLHEAWSQLADRAKTAEPPKAKKGRPAATPTAEEPAPTEVSAPVETVVESPSSPPVTLEQVRAKLGALSQNGKMPEVKAILTGLGYAKLTEVPADKYAEVLEKAEAL